MRYEVTANRIREAMSDLGMSQQELADKSKLGKSSISHYVNGSNEPGNKSAYALAEVLNVNPGWLMGLDVPKESMETLQKKMTQTRLDFLDIDSEDENALKENSDLFKGLKEDYLKILSAEGGTGKSDVLSKALELYSKYENAIPEIQSAVDGLLKVPRQDS